MQQRQSLRVRDCTVANASKPGRVKPAQKLVYRKIWNLGWAQGKGGAEVTVQTLFCLVTVSLAHCEILQIPSNFLNCTIHKFRAQHQAASLLGLLFLILPGEMLGDERLDMVKTIVSLVVVLFFTVALTGCGKLSRAEAVWTGYAVECVEGVAYLQFPSGVTVKYTADGKIQTCQK